jgi:hypothetical protein
MGRVARLILLVVVSVCVVCCVLCCLQNNLMFSSVTTSHIYIYLLTLNKKRKMKIMGRVARLILLVVVSVCVVFCVLCFLQKNPMFLSVTISHILKMKIMSYVFGQVSSSIKLRPEKITTTKKRYSRLAVGWNKSQITICRVKIRTPTITRKITTRKKKGTVVWPSVGINLR